MTDYRTDSDKAIHILIVEIIDALAPGKMGRIEFVHAMGKLRDIKTFLDYKQLGCPSGTHASACLCDSHPKFTVDYHKRHRGRAA